LPKNDPVLNMIGIARKAGKVSAGEFEAENLIRSGKAKVVIIAGDSSDNTKKKFSDKCSFYHVPFYIFSTKEELGHAIGREMRTAVALSDDGLSNTVIRLIQQSGGKED